MYILKSVEFLIYELLMRKLEKENSQNTLHVYQLKSENLKHSQQLCRLLLLQITAENCSIINNALQRYTRQKSAHRSMIIKINALMIESNGGNSARAIWH